MDDFYSDFVLCLPLSPALMHYTPSTAERAFRLTSSFSLVALMKPAAHCAALPTVQFPWNWAWNPPIWIWNRIDEGGLRLKRPAAKAEWISMRNGESTAVSPLVCCCPLSKATHYPQWTSRKTKGRDQAEGGSSKGQRSSPICCALCLAFQICSKLVPDFISTVSLETSTPVCFFLKLSSFFPCFPWKGMIFSL